MEEELEIIGSELARVAWEGGELVKEEEIRRCQLHAMKKGVRMCLPKPIMHPTKLIDDASGSKQHIMSQCVYFAFKSYPFWGHFPRKHVFLKRNFQMKCFETFYTLYL
jgi:hypothetical protein